MMWAWFSWPITERTVASRLGLDFLPLFRGTWLIYEGTESSTNRTSIPSFEPPILFLPKVTNSPSCVDLICAPLLLRYFN